MDSGSSLAVVPAVGLMFPAGLGLCVAVAGRLIIFLLFTTGYLTLLGRDAVGSFPICAFCSGIAMGIAVVGEAWVAS